ncbi:Aspartate 1-decarboxylase precursor [Planctomycetes bacterium Pan216]|uniref:Aspartate 1-decarboxylase n=1 Tax=Kolteria novifilia TaxID=2527975 RepID=A0A518B5V5_9BACT|nr:Aspartate 1-decarboxylase precursor [Planctomycetes bacterium Pan216]
MHLRLLKSKLHKATVTETVLDYHGSVTIDEDLMEAVGLLASEVVTIANLSTGQRAETYVIRGQRGSGIIGLNGAVARLAEPGDRIIVFSYAFLTPDEVASHQPRVAILDEHNAVVERWEEPSVS